MEAGGEVCVVMHVWRAPVQAGKRLGRQATGVAN
jgi:hypothetical protein